MAGSSREGYIEAVVFALFKDGEEVFIPNGGIEEKDKDGGKDYRIKALKREAKEG